MFTFLSWDSLGELLSEIGMVLLLCVFLFIWAARVRRQEDARRATLRSSAEAPVAAPPPGAVSAARPLVADERDPAPGNDPHS
jgi:hypothetical protein